MRKLNLILGILLLVACGESNKQNQENTSQDEAFEAYKSSLVEQLWEHNPIWASFEGYHKYDSLLPLPNDEREQVLMKFWTEQDQKLQEFKLEQLSENNQIDYYLIRDQIASDAFYREKYQAKTWNPSSYNLGGVFYQVINYREQSLEDRLKAISIKLENVPAYYDLAKENLETPTEVHTELAIQQLKGSLGVFEGTLLDSLNASKHDETFKNEFKLKIESVVQAIGAYVSFLRDEVQPKLAEEARSFRIGKELFEEKFKHDIQSAYTAEEIYGYALEEKELLHDKMFASSEELWEKYYPKKEKPADRLEQIKLVIEAVSQKHVKRDGFIAAIRKQIPELEAFVQENDLITLDPEKPLVVRETPEYMRGFAGASISAPGPYDKNAETYYNVTPLDDYTEEQAESYLREYNHYTLQILNIHEAVPGHYTQLVYSNQSPSIIKSIFGNGAMVEGWAVYTELMMLENGYGNGEAEMDLMYYKWNLRTVCNTILDYSIHVENMSEEEAMDLLINQAFQEQSEANGKWRRARLSQVQLCSYFTGYYEIRALRDEMRQKLGDQFDLKEFHETFLSYGSAPVKYIRQLMLKNIEEKKGLV